MYEDFLTVDKYIINGGNSLYGCVEIGSAKNSVLPILAGAVLCDGVVTIENCPAYTDVLNMLDLLKTFGVRASFSNNTLKIDATNITRYEVPMEQSVKTRASIFCLGALLGRFKKAKVAYPGGCEIGARPIDLHLKGLQALNVKILDRHGYITCDGSNMRGGDVHLDFPSVGATENIMLAGATSKGTTKIVGCATEPEIVDLQNFLNKAGAKIYGAGTNQIVIQGVKKLKSVTHRPIPDRIIAGTYLLANVICGGELIIKNFPHKHLFALTEKLDKSAVRLWKQKSMLIAKTTARHKAIEKIETLPYPAFPTDLQAPMVAMLATASGTSLVIENLFESRFRYTQELSKMGAKIKTNGKLAMISGVPTLYGAEVQAQDLRGGASLVLASLMAKGQTTISGVKHIERGYENLPQILKLLGANITAL